MQFRCLFAKCFIVSIKYTFLKCDTSRFYFIIGNSINLVNKTKTIRLAVFKNPCF